MLNDHTLRDVPKRLSQVITQIRQAESDYQRPPGSVKLLAVSKGQDIHAIKEAIKEGQWAFGESYLQESLGKMAQLTEKKLEWHFIGSLQMNKAKKVAENFSWVQSVDSLKVAERLNTFRPLTLGRLNICIEVNINEAQSKTGVAKNKVRALAEVMSELPQLLLRGLMVIPQVSQDFQEQKMNFFQVALLQQELIAAGFSLDTLSMGMSEDFVAAIAAGSNQVRIGTAVFGTRV